MESFFLKALPCVLALVAGSLQIRGIDGGVLRPLEPAGIANVLFFVATDCPISNSYAPEIQRICGAYEARGIGCALIYEEARLTADDARKHLDQYRYRRMPGAIDRDGALAAAVHASVTPEAVVGDRHGAIRYRGRIANPHAALGRPRQVVTTQHPHDALNAVAAGRPVAALKPSRRLLYQPSDLRRK